MGKIIASVRAGIAEYSNYSSGKLALPVIVAGCTCTIQVKQYMHALNGVVIYKNICIRLNQFGVEQCCYL